MLTSAEALKIAKQRVKAHLEAIYNKIHNMPLGYHYTTIIPAYKRK